MKHLVLRLCHILRGILHVVQDDNIEVISVKWVNISTISLELVQPKAKQINPFIFILNHKITIFATYNTNISTRGEQKP